MENQQKLMIGHALIVIIFGLLGGFMLIFGLVGGLEIFPGMIVEMPYYGTTEGWVRAHSGGITNGLLMIVVALCLPYIKFGEGMTKLTVYGIIFMGWANTAFYWFGNAAANRALTFGDNPQGETDLFGLIGVSGAFFGAFLTIFILAALARHILKSRI